MNYLLKKACNNTIRICKENKWAILFLIFEFFVIRLDILRVKIYFNSPTVPIVPRLMLFIFYMLLIYGSYKYFSYVNTKSRLEKYITYICVLAIAMWM
jgi:hypothetical protein